jgi:AcrR family transcriptional regulator
MTESAAGAAAERTAGGRLDVKGRILETASELFYRRGVRAVGVDLVVEEAGVAKTSLYRHFRTKDELIAAFLAREDADFWATWDRVAELEQDDAVRELEAQLDWIGARIGRPHYRGCPQLNVAAEFPDHDHPAHKVAAAHKREMRRRFEGIAVRLGVQHPDVLGGQLSLLINGAFVSAQVLSPDEATQLLRGGAQALIAAARSRHSEVGGQQREPSDE